MADRPLLALGEIEEEHRSILAADCLKAGFAPEWVESTETAAENLSNKGYDVLLFHLMTPGAAAVAIKARGKLARGRFPIIALAEDMDDGAFNRAFRAGADDVIPLGIAGSIAARLGSIPRPSRVPPGKTRGEALVGDPDRIRSDLLEQVLTDAGYRVEIVRDELAVKLNVGRPGIKLVVLDQSVGDIVGLYNQSKHRVGAMWVLRTKREDTAELSRKLRDSPDVAITGSYGPPDDVLYEANRLSASHEKDSRADPRLLYGNIVHFREPGKGPCYGFSYNISPSGLYVRTMAVPHADPISLEITPPGMDEPINLSGSVAWRRGFGPTSREQSPPGFGVQLTGGNLMTWADCYRKAYSELRGRHPDEDAPRGDKARGPRSAGSPGRDDDSETPTSLELPHPRTGPPAKPSKQPSGSIPTPESPAKKPSSPFAAPSPPAKRPSGSLAAPEPPAKKPSGSLPLPTPHGPPAKTPSGSLPAPTDPTAPPRKKSSGSLRIPIPASAASDPPKKPLVNRRAPRLAPPTPESPMRMIALSKPELPKPSKEPFPTPTPRKSLSLGPTQPSGPPRLSPAKLSSRTMTGGMLSPPRPGVPRPDTPASPTPPADEATAEGAERSSVEGLLNESLSDRPPPDGGERPLEVGGGFDLTDPRSAKIVESSPPDAEPDALTGAELSSDSVKKSLEPPTIPKDAAALGRSPPRPVDPSAQFKRTAIMPTAADLAEAKDASDRNDRAELEMAPIVPARELARDAKPGQPAAIPPDDDVGAHAVDDVSPRPSPEPDLSPPKLPTEAGGPSSSLGPSSRPSVMAARRRRSRRNKANLAIGAVAVVGGVVIGAVLALRTPPEPATTGATAAKPAPTKKRPLPEPPPAHEATEAPLGAPTPSAAAPTAQASAQVPAAPAASPSPEPSKPETTTPAGTAEPSPIPKAAEPQSQPPTAPAIEPKPEPEPEPQQAAEPEPAPPAATGDIPEGMAHLYVESPLDTNVYVHGKLVGKTNVNNVSYCGTRFIRLGSAPGQWQSEGKVMKIECDKENRTTIP